MDSLQLYFGNDLVINEHITVRQPTLRDVIEMGEEEYYGLVFSLTAISSDLKSTLWDAGIDWTNVSDLEMFFMMSSIIPIERTRILFGDLDLQGFGLYQREDGDLIMVNKDNVVIDMYIHKQIMNFLCLVHNIKKKPEFAGNELTKKFLIEDDRQRIARQRNKPYESQLLPLVSAMVNSPGFKYDLETVQNMKLYAFMDSVRRIQLIRSTFLLTEAYYGGHLDEKFNTSKLDWLCDLNKVK